MSLHIFLLLERYYDKVVNIRRCIKSYRTCEILESIEIIRTLVQNDLSLKRYLRIFPLKGSKAYQEELHFRIFFCKHMHNIHL